MVRIYVCEVCEYASEIGVFVFVVFLFVDASAEHSSAHVSSLVRLVLQHD